ncbi:small ribosomal subunit biogenesis GTPase RsgA [Spongiibacter sp. KMU-158]|uniref:Small ribosomal subunit biogenesis GTPase RsgA n=1 Tax=Spongiibacter pelagi TaxID=2760804 RepID=A0A927GVB4_9GAMM|nr:small ribosomal subunit biogenesis GTPase RsgA [Spongiibacter pelagi]MBD2857898.1 small ribosomal subunit biogenesis GTPase RsgA [Spongiibacter pelagi]
MSKRKISRQQRWRIEKIQQERSERAAKRDAALDSSLGDGSLGPEQEGLVVSHFGQQVEVEGQDGQRQRCHVRSNIEALVTGDSVVWQAGNPTGVIVARQTRRSLLERPDNFNRLKPVAANIDRIVIVFAVEPEAHANLIDRYLVAAETVGIPPLLLLNKADLIDSERHQKLLAMCERYQAIGYPLIQASKHTEHGLDDLSNTLNDHISVFVGQSGVGKSSLINCLLPGTDTRVGELSEATAKGRHTTTTARLFHFPAGGSLIDSPGIREFALWNLDREAISQGFIEFRPYLGLCRFRDCRHEQEPGCALLEAAEQGKIFPERLFSYRQIIASISEN